MAEISEKSEDMEKTESITEKEVEAAGVEHGHLQELEVDLSKTLQEAGIDEIESDHSPYPEGMKEVFQSILWIHGRD